ncbi:hypothetical protein PGT21_033964 [Puccinia graminis f. sp. tritici]|uniref:Uncharacterized protein n=1 Tax=Puccinia graminis f. sp. tritici TaxID=56615 RepID=A0A5B0QY52_PUCGR|nr:hypothetical protein PGT21_033964 [Puccinia graminis f. sp. tritici]
MKNSSAQHLLAVCLLVRPILAGQLFTEAGPTLAALDLSKQDPSSSWNGGAPATEAVLGISRPFNILVNELDETRQPRRVRQKLKHHPPEPFTISSPAQHIHRRLKDFDLNHSPPPSPPEQVPIEYLPAEELPLEQGSVADVSAEKAPVEQVKVQHLAEHDPVGNIHEQVPIGNIHEQVPVGYIHEQVPAEQITEQQVPLEQAAQLHPKLDLDLLDMNEPPPKEFSLMISITHWAVVHPVLFIKYHTLFKEQVDFYTSKYAGKLLTKPGETFKDLPIYILRHMEPESDSSRWMILPKIIRLPKQRDPAASQTVQAAKPELKGRIQIPFMINQLLGSLIKGILFAHGAFLREIQCPVEEEIRRHDSLMKWLNELIFSTKNHPPICGEISPADWARVEGRGYTPAQRRLIYYLQGRPEGENLYVDYMALSLIGIWYKRDAPEEWLRHFQGSEYRFWMRMEDSITEVKRVRNWKAGKWIDQGLGEQKPDSKLGNFDLVSLRQVVKLDGSPHSKDKRYSWKVIEDFEPSEVEARVIRGHPRVTELVDLAIGRPMKPIKDARAALQLGSEKSTGQPVWAVRVIGLKGRPYPARGLKRKLIQLFGALRHYHQQLLKFFEEYDIPTIPKAHEAFLDWFTETLRKPSEPMALPLFGYVSEQGGELDATRFNPIQHLVLLFITTHSKALDGTTDVVALLGYWYKNHHPAYWAARFRSEFCFGQAVLLTQMPRSRADTVVRAIGNTRKQLQTGHTIG